MTMLITREEEALVSTFTACFNGQ